MRVSLNKKIIEVGQQDSIETLLSKANVPVGKGIAIAVNERIIKHSAWKEFMLKDGDDVLVIRASQGG